MGRPVVYLACWKKHIGLYPVPELDEALEQQVDPYLSGGTAKFALTKPIPQISWRSMKATVVTSGRQGAESYGWSRLTSLENVLSSPLLFCS